MESIPGMKGELDRASAAAMVAGEEHQRPRQKNRPRFHGRFMSGDTLSSVWRLWVRLPPIAPGPNRVPLLLAVTRGDFYRVISILRVIVVPLAFTL